MYSFYQGHQTVPNVDKSHQTSVNGRTILNEPVILTLQREVENYTRKLEQQERQLKVLKETHQIVLKEHVQISQKIQDQKNNQFDKQKLITNYRDDNQLDPKSTQKKKKSVTQRDNKLKADNQIKQKANIEQNLIEKINAKFNLIHTANDQLQIEINKQRKSRMQLIDIIKRINQHIQQNNEVSYKKLDEMKKTHDETNHLKSKILDQFGVENNELKFQRLHFFKVKEEFEKNKVGSNQPKGKNKSDKQEFYDQQIQYDLIKYRLKKAIYNNKEKLKVIEQYQKNLKIIEDAFQQIKEGSGITDIQEITSTFIKSEEQNYSLYSYVDILSQDIEYLENRKTQLDKQYEQLQKENEEKIQLQNQTPRKEQIKNKLKTIDDKNQLQIDSLLTKIKDIQPLLEQTLAQLFSLDEKTQTKQSQYESGVDLNEQNFEQYFSDLELFVNKYVEIKSYKKNRDISMIANSLLIDEVNVKKFNLPSLNLTNQLSEEINSLKTKFKSEIDYLKKDQQQGKDVSIEPEKLSNQQFRKQAIDVIDQKITYQKQKKKQNN